MTMVDTTEKTFISEDTLPQKTKPFTEPIPRTTGDVVFPSSDQFEVKKSHEQIVQEGIEIEARLFEAWLSMRVKDELVAQVIKNARDIKWQVDVKPIIEIVTKELRLQKDRSFQAATDLENRVIPLAMTRSEFIAGDPNFYTQDDVDSLYARIEIYMSAAETAAAVEATGDQGLHDLSTEYATLLLPDAKNEALAVLLQQRQDNLAKLAETEKFIEALGGKIFQGAPREEEPITEPLAA